MLGDPILTDAILDRLIRSTHKILLKGESMCKVQAKDDGGGLGNQDFSSSNWFDAWYNLYIKERCLINEHT